MKRMGEIKRIIESHIRCMAPSRQVSKKQDIPEHVEKVSWPGEKGSTGHRRRDHSTNVRIERQCTVVIGTEEYRILEENQNESEETALEWGRRSGITL